MALLITSIVESLLNPTLCFNSIKSIKTLGPVDDIVRGCSKGVFSANVTLDSQSWILYCNLDSRKGIAAEAKEIVNSLSGVDRSLVYEMQYFQREMIVFDDDSQPHELDVMLIRSEQGVKLSERLIELFIDGRTDEFKKLSISYGEMLRSFVGSTTSKLRLRAEDIMLCKDGALRVFNYVVGADTLRGYLCSSLLLLLMRSNQPLSRQFKSMLSFPSHILGRHISELRSEANRLGLSYLTRACEILCDESIQPLRSEVYDLLEQIDHLELLLDSSEAVENLIASESVSSQQPLALFNDYDDCGPLSCGVMAVSKGGLWGYIDSNGETVLPTTYDWVDDFFEHRAIVMRGDLYGLVDSGGDIVIPVAYDYMEWDRSGQVVQVGYEGLFGVVDRQGKLLVELEYNWVGAMSNSLMPALKDGLYGYIDATGAVRVPFIYEDAYSFNNGVAVVVKDGKESLISAAAYSI